MLRAARVTRKDDFRRPCALGTWHCWWDLLRNGVSLAGIRLDDAWLEGVQLPEARLFRASMQRANLSRGNFAAATLEGADLRDAELVGADLSDANLRGANLAGARLAGAIMNGADLTDVSGWRELRSISHAGIDDVRHAPTGFIEFAREQGAGASADDSPIAEGERSYSNHFRDLTSGRAAAIACPQRWESLGH